MMRIKSIIFALSTATLLASCSGAHLTSDATKRAVINEDFNTKKALFKDSTVAENIFAVAEDKSLSTAEREGVKFLLAYSPLTDLTLGNDFFVENVRSAIKAREEMPWGKEISDDMFLHFVLPVRVNNENLDSARQVFYRELAPRVKGLSLKDAALEVNHWCHEKVIYTPSDSRTSSPLASVRSASGRCGEESVFTVAALRSVGIPARQVYTPRWAHSDDNHAWVEIWGGDKWYYMGACEPDPKLDMGWFTAPSMRGMLMHTKVFGRYNGKEEVMSETPCYTEVNVTENYAPVRKVTVKVVDTNRKPVKNADVKFMIYNYAEFYPVVTKKSDTNGEVSLSMGLGDAMVWASDGKLFSYDRMSAEDNNELTLILDKGANVIGGNLFDIIPPVEKKPKINVSDSLKAINAKRLHEEDSIRTIYTITFPDSAKTETIAKELNIDPATARRLITASRGNHAEIVNFLKSADNRDDALALLDVISAKDLRDMKSNIMLSHLRGATPYKDKYEREIFVNYILNPRVDNEWVTAYRDTLASRYGKMSADDIVYKISKIKINNAYNRNAAPVTAQSAAIMGITDEHSRDILFVSACRSAGIAARLNPATRAPQYLSMAGWKNVNFNNYSAVITPKSKVHVSFKPIKSVAEPIYGTHFTFAKIDEKTLFPQTIEISSNSNVDMGGGSKASSIFKDGIELETGYYIMTCGTRLASGAVLARTEFFAVKEGETTTLDISMRENNNDIFVLGSINPEARLTLADTGKEVSLLDVTGRGYYILALVESNKEPTNHSMRALEKLDDDLKAWGRPTVLVFKSKDDYNKFNKAEFPNLPKCNFVIDSKGEVFNMLKAFNKQTPALPMYVIADSFGRVVFASEGYQINLGDNILKTISNIK